MPIRKRVSGTAKRKRWVLDYYDEAGELRHKTFKNRRDAKCFLEKIQVRISELTTVVNKDELNCTLHQHSNTLTYQKLEPLTIRAIIEIIGKMWLTTATLTCGGARFSP